MHHARKAAPRHGEQGFTLIEALIAMVILIVGIAAISNLMVVAGTSNAAANSTTGASAVAAQQMELLKSQTFTGLAAGGGVIVPPVHAGGHPPCGQASVAPGKLLPATRRWPAWARSMCSG